MSRSAGETRAGLVVDGLLMDYEVHRDHAPSRLGGIYLGRIRKRTAAGRSAFVDIGGVEALTDLDATAAEATGWSLAEGRAVPVQIVQEARRGRLARGTTRLAFMGPRLVFLPFGDNDGVSHRVSDPTARRKIARLLERLDRGGGARIARLRAVDAAIEALNREAAALAATWAACAAALGERRSPGPLVPPPAPGVALLRDAVDPATDAIECDDRGAAAAIDAARRTFFPDAPPPTVVAARDMDDAFDGLEDQIEAALSRRVALDGGGSIVIERTEGLTAVDVDAGGVFHAASPGRGVHALNRRAAAAIARQLRLRAIGGLVVVDLVGSTRGRQASAVIAAFRQAFHDDPMRTEIDHVQRPGVVLLSRQWSRRPLAEIVAAVPPADDGPAPDSLDTVVLRAARLAQRATSRSPAARLAVHLSAATASHWGAAHLAPAIAELSAARGAVPSVVAHPDWPTSRVEIETG